MLSSSPLTTQKVREIHLQTKYTDVFEITFKPDEAVDAIKAPQAIISKGHKEYRTRRGRGQKQGNEDELMSMPETFAETVWV